MFSVGMIFNMKNKKEIVKKIWIENEKVCYVEGNYTFDFKISELYLIGEYTNQSGPYADDYFIVFFAKKEKYEFLASFYVEGIDKFILELGCILSCDLAFELVNSTDFKSRVMWPPELKEEKLFNFTEVVGETFLKKVKLKIISEVYLDYNKRILDYLIRGKYENFS